MRRSSILFNLLGAVGLFGLLSGCDSGGGGASPGTASGSAAASGTITGFGSVVVNGKRFDTSGSSFEVDGEQNKKQGDLKLGMTVTVTGSFNGNQWSASTVQQKDAVEGLVQSINADWLSLVVMGQTVVVNSATETDKSPSPIGLDGNIRNLVAGDFVEVNGHIRPDGVIQATFIERKDPGAVTPEVRGFVSAHAPVANTFKIGNLTVNYTGVDISKMPDPNGNVWDGLFVEVKGSQFVPALNVQPPQGTLSATRVEPQNLGLGNTVDDFEVEGFVTQTQVDGSADFLIGTTRVRTAASTQFLGGTIDNIVVGAKLSAQGRLASGILMAKHVKFNARAVIIGFGSEFTPVPPGLNGTEAGFLVAPNGSNDWSIAEAGGNNFASSTVNGSSFFVESLSSGFDDKGRPIFPEFTVQGFDVSSIGGNSTFFIVGLADRDDQNAELFRFSYSVSDGTGFERISLADEGRRLSSSFNPRANNDPTDDGRTSFDVNLDKVQRVIISVAHGDGVTSRVDSVHVGEGGQ